MRDSRFRCSRARAKWCLLLRNSYLDCNRNRRRRPAFSPAEFELLVNGRREIDVDEVRAYAIFQGGIDGEAPLALWLWQALREITPDERGRVLAFVTGSDRVPLDGYDPPFNVTLGSDMAKSSLPKSHIGHNVRLES